MSPRAGVFRVFLPFSLDVSHRCPGRSPSSSRLSFPSARKATPSDASKHSSVAGRRIARGRIRNVSRSTPKVLGVSGDRAKWGWSDYLMSHVVTAAAARRRSRPWSSSGIARVGDSTECAASSFLSSESDSLRTAAAIVSPRLLRSRFQAVRFSRSFGMGLKGASSPVPASVGEGTVPRPVRAVDATGAQGADGWRRR